MLGERMILIGGIQYSAPNYIREVYESTDGKTWSELLAALPFAGDRFSEAVAFDGKLWAFTGTGGDAHAAEVWSSADAVTWARVTAHAAFAPRADVRVLAYNGLLWAGIPEHDALPVEPRATLRKTRCFQPEALSCHNCAV